MPVTAPENPWINEFAHHLFENVLVSETSAEKHDRFMREYSKLQRAFYKMRMRNYLRSLVEMAIDAHPNLREFFQHGAVVPTSTKTEASCLVVHDATPPVTEINLVMHGQFRTVRFMSRKDFDDQWNSRMDALRKFYPTQLSKKTNPVGFNFPYSPRFKA